MVHLGRTPAGVSWNVYPKDGESDQDFNHRVRETRMLFDAAVARQSLKGLARCYKTSRSRLYHARGTGSYEAARVRTRALCTAIRRAERALERLNDFRVQRGLAPHKVPYVVVGSADWQQL